MKNHKPVFRQIKMPNGKSPKAWVEAIQKAEEEFRAEGIKRLQLSVGHYWSSSPSVTVTGMMQMTEEEIAEAEKKKRAEARRRANEAARAEKLKIQRAAKQREKERIMYEKLRQKFEGSQTPY